MRESIEDNFSFIADAMNGELYRPSAYALPVTYQEESGEEFVPAIKQYVEPHWLEAGRDHADIPVDIDFPGWLGMEQRGQTLVVTARKGPDLVGYVVSGVIFHPNYKSSKFCVVMVYYVAPPYRGQGHFRAMTELTESLARARGVVRVTNRMKPDNLEQASLLKHGYRITEIVLEKVLR